MQRPRPDSHRPRSEASRGPARFNASYNGNRRRQNHEEAEAEALKQVEAAIPDDALICRDNPVFVTTPQGLARMGDHLRQAGAFGFDTEFIGEQSYFPKLCLVQVATAQKVFVIDAMSRDLDLAPFWELAADPELEKVVHAGLQDLEPVMRYTGKPPANIFDTQIAAAFAGFNYPVGLARLVESFTGVALGKGMKFSQWDRRPLSQVQIRYAAADVRFLLALRREILAKVEAAGNTAAAQEECATLCDPKLYGFDPQVQYQRVRGAGMLKPRELAVLRELVIWRDERARHHDLPPRTLLPDPVLVQLARNPKADADALKEAAGMPRPVLTQHGDELIEAIERGLAAAPKELPPQMRLKETPVEKEAIAALWLAMEQVGVQRQIDPTMICSRSELSETCRQLARGTMPQHSRLFTGWRQQVAAPVIRQALMSPGPSASDKGDEKAPKP